MKIERLPTSLFLNDVHPIKIIEEVVLYLARRISANQISEGPRQTSEKP